jgi:hypothetical protein
VTRKSRLRLETTATVHDTGRARSVVIEWEPSQGDLITLRLAGTRRRYPVDLGRAYVRAVANAVEQERRDKKANRRAR